MRNPLFSTAVMGAVLAATAAASSAAAQQIAQPMAQDPPILPPKNPFCTAVYLAASALSDYRFDGFSESDRAPTWQANLHCYRTDGFYAGVVTTGVNFEDTPRTRLEVDYYAGRHLAVAGSDLNLSLLYASFPTQRTAGPSYSILEPQAQLTHTWALLTLSAEGAWSPNYSGGGRAWLTKEGLSIKLTPWLDAGGHIGGLWIARGYDRSYFDAGLTAHWRRWTVDGRYGGTDLKRQQCYYTNWCAPGPSLTLTYRLLP